MREIVPVETYVYDAPFDRYGKVVEVTTDLPSDLPFSTQRFKYHDHDPVFYKILWSDWEFPRITFLLNVID